MSEWSKYMGLCGTLFQQSFSLLLGWPLADGHHFLWPLAAIHLRWISAAMPKCAASTNTSRTKRKKEEKKNSIRNIAVFYISAVDSSRMRRISFNGHYPLTRYYYSMIFVCVLFVRLAGIRLVKTYASANDSYCADDHFIIYYLTVEHARWSSYECFPRTHIHLIVRNSHWEIRFVGAFSRVDIELNIMRFSLCLFVYKFTAVHTRTWCVYILFDWTSILMHNRGIRLLEYEFWNFCFLFFAIHWL